MNKSLGHCLVLHCCETTSLALFHCHHTGQTLVSHMRASVVLLLLPLLPMTVKPLTHFCIELQYKLLHKRKYCNALKALLVPGNQSGCEL